MRNFSKISNFETYSIRKAVLRTGKSIRSCQFEDDDLPSKYDFWYFLNDTLVGIISNLKNNNSIFAPEKKYHIREWSFWKQIKKKESEKY
jgi:hypothetical protein